MTIADRLESVRGKIAAAAIAANRQPSAITLIAVTKTRPISEVIEAMAAGQLDFGENKVQDLIIKQAAIPAARWHMIGRLQRNKVRQIAAFVHLIHSIDSVHLLAEVNRQAQLHGRVIDCLLQINISNEPQKGGMSEQEALDILTQVRDYPNVVVQGLMGMAEFTEDMQVIRDQFRSLAEMRDRLRALPIETIKLETLSMGMSGDFEIAISEGATMVRVGSSIFGMR